MPKRSLDLGRVRQPALITPDLGLAPAVALVNPKFGVNVARALRTCSCYDVPQLWVTGDRVIEEWRARGRLPREERMRSYGDVQVVWGDHFFRGYGRDVTFVAVEVRPNAELLPAFVHPDKAVYVFGPEDGSLEKTHRLNCHRFVIIPTRECLNLGDAVATVLYDRHAKRAAAGLDPQRASYDLMRSPRGFQDADPQFAWKE